MTTRNLAAWNRNPVNGKLQWDSDPNWPIGLVADFRFFLNDTYAMIKNGMQWEYGTRTIATPPSETEKGGVYGFIGSLNPTSDDSREQRFSFNELGELYIKRRTYIPSNYFHRDTVKLTMTGDITAWVKGDTIKGADGLKTGTLYYKSGTDIWLLFADSANNAAYWVGTITNTTKGQTATSTAKNLESANNKFFALWCDGYSSTGQSPTIVLHLVPNNTGGSRITFAYGHSGGGTGSQQNQNGGTPDFIGASDLGTYIDTILYIKMATTEAGTDGKIDFYVRKEGETDYTKIFNKTDWAIGARPPLYAQFKNGYCWGWSNSGYEANTDFYETQFMLSSTTIDGVS